MPFQSEKQRRYLHANHPEIAKRWERDYATGGILDINESEEIIDDGGNEIALTDYNAAFDDPNDLSTGVKSLFQAKEGGTPRRSYFTGAYGVGGTENQGSSSRDTGSDYGQFDRAVSQAANNPPSTKSDSGGDGVYQDRIIRIAEQDKRTKELRDKASKEGWHQFLTPKAPPQAKKTITPGSVGVNLLTTFLTGGISNPWTKAAANKIVKYGANKIGVDNMINTFVDEKFGSIDEMKSKIEARVAKEDLIQSLPRGHPERIQLEESVKTKTTPKDGPNGDGGVTQETSIKIENIEEVNDAKTQLQQKYQEMDEASLLAWQRQQEMQAKKEAYLRNFRQMYMSAQGGRVPAGYNTGGLSNLFRLKNR